MARRKVAATKRKPAPKRKPKAKRRRAPAKGRAPVARALSPTPFAFEIEVLEPPPGQDGPRLLTQVRNIAGSGKRILVDIHLQPVILVLRRNGVVIAPFDERSRKKFDPTRHTWHFRVLGPSSAYSIQEDVFRREDGAWSLHYGTFTFSRLPAGRYQAHARFTSAGTDWHDGEKSGHYDDLWEGTVDSPVVEIVLP